MAAHSPEQCDHLLIEALHRSDVEAALALYEPACSFVVDSGESVSGLEGIRKLMEAYVEAGVRFTLEEVKAVPCGDGTLALTRARWRASGTDGNGNPVEFSGHSIEVVRRQPDGTWRFAIDVPQEGNWERVPGP